MLYSEGGPCYIIYAIISINLIIERHINETASRSAAERGAS